MSEWHSIFSMCIIIYNFFIYSPLDGQLGCSHVLAIVSFAAMNIGVHQSFQGIVFYQMYAQDWNCWIIWKLCFYNFEELSYCFPQWLHQLTLPQQCKRVSLFSTPSPASVIHQVSNDGHFDRYEVVRPCSVDFLSLLLAMLSIFSYAYWPSVYLLLNHRYQLWEWPLWILSKMNDTSVNVSWMCSESSLTLLVKGQSDEVFRKGIVTLFGKPADQRDGKLVPQRIILPELEGFWGEW